ncbi:unnamed protein product [Haemonchus placei]|uniref:Late endosomal/lysosomal adaptor and MAPK and MTOR activator 5 n=1 Tax=Haemonchus placei TaxID=6290 RepID=A0A0N4VTX7_HAEPC|nr:unnamed protein product [Haemonchus placei]
MVNMSDVEETIKRIQSQKGVVGVIVMDSAGESGLILFDVREHSCEIPFLRLCFIVYIL